MRKLILAGWIAFLMTTGTVAAQQPAASEPWANKLFAGTTSKDFGMVAKGAQLKYSFRMTNIYKVPLEITNVPRDLRLRHGQGKRPRHSAQ